LARVRDLKDLKLLINDIKKTKSEIIRLNGKIATKTAEENLLKQKQADLTMKQIKLKKLVQNIDNQQVKYEIKKLGLF